MDQTVLPSETTTVDCPKVDCEQFEGLCQEALRLVAIRKTNFRKNGANGYGKVIQDHAEGLKAAVAAAVNDRLLTSRL